MAYFKGTNASQKIVGTDGSDTVDAGGGNDWIFAYMGDAKNSGVHVPPPTVDPFAGNADAEDLIRGGAGNDRLFAGAGTVTFLYDADNNGYDIFSNGSGTSIALAEDSGVTIGVKGYANGVDAIQGAGDTIIRDFPGGRILDFSATDLSGISLVDAGNGDDTVTTSSSIDSSSPPLLYDGGSGHEDILRLGLSEEQLFSPETRQEASGYLEHLAAGNGAELYDFESLNISVINFEVFEAPDFPPEHIGYELEIAGVLDYPVTSRMHLTNTSSSAQIESFSITIGDTAYQFDYVLYGSALDHWYEVYPDRLLDDKSYDPGGDLVLYRVKPTTNDDGDLDDSDEDELAFTFTGFDAGDTTTFWHDIDTDGRSDVVSEEHIFTNNGEAPNATITVAFSTGQTLEFTLPDEYQLQGPDGQSIYVSQDLLV